MRISCAVLALAVTCSLTCMSSAFSATSSGLDTPSGVADLPFAINGVEVMDMTSTGLGVGLTGPTQKLDIDGYVRIRSINGEGGVIQLDGNNGTTMWMENLNGVFRLINSPWNEQLFSVDQNGSVVAANGYAAFGTNSGTNCSSTYSSLMLAGSHIWDGCNGSLNIAPGGGAGYTLWIYGSITPGVNSGIYLGNGCGSHPEGAIAYDYGNHKPVYCSNSGVWTAMGFTSCRVATGASGWSSGWVFAVAYCNGNETVTGGGLSCNGGYYTTNFQSYPSGNAWAGGCWQQYNNQVTTYAICCQ